MNAPTPRYGAPADLNPALILEARLASIIEQIAMLEGFDAAAVRTQGALARVAEMLRRRGVSTVTGVWFG